MSSSKVHARLFCRVAWITIAILSVVLGTAANYIITTAAGGALPATPVSALSAQLRLPTSVAVDRTGNLYFVSDNCIFRIDTAGTLTRIAGASSVTGYSGDGGPALNAHLWGPRGLAIDSSGSVFVSDSNVVRRISPSGVITTVAGNGTRGYSGDGGPAVKAALNYPQGVAVDAAGNLYIADTWNNVVRKVSPDGTISTYAGNAIGNNNGDGGPALNAAVAGPTYLAIDSAGNLFITAGKLIRRVSASDRTISTVAGTTSTQSGSGSGDGGPATSAQLNFPMGIAVDPAGNLYIVDNLTRVVRKVSTSGIITTVAGGGTQRTGDGGPATSEYLSTALESVAVDRSGNLYLNDWNSIRRVETDGIITTAAGKGPCCYSGDGGPAVGARLNSPAGVAIDKAGNLYISDAMNDRIRRVTPAGVISTFAGNGSWGYSGDGGAATSAELNYPQGIAIDSADNLYIADSQNSVVRKVTPAGTITTVAGNGHSGYSGDGGQATVASLIHPVSVSVDPSRNLYIVDDWSNTVRKMDASGIITTIADINSVIIPRQVAVDGSGIVYVVQDSHQVVRLGTSGARNSLIPRICAGPDDGVCSAAGIAADARGNLYVTDVSNSTVGILDASGQYTHVAGAGEGGAGYSGDGGPALAAYLNYPGWLAVDASGNLYVADVFANVVRKITPGGSTGAAALTIAKSHPADLLAGEHGATWSVVVSNAGSAGNTSGTVTVTENPPESLTVVSMSGTGWTCSGKTCTRSDMLAAGLSYPPITVSTDVAANAPASVTNSVTVSGGGSQSAAASNTASVDSPPAPAATPVAPVNGATAVSLSPTLTWSAVPRATSYDVWFGPASSMQHIGPKMDASYSPGVLSPGTTYSWYIVATNSWGSVTSPTWSFTTGAISSSGDAYFIVDVPPVADSIVVRITDAAVIGQARAMIAGTATGSLRLTGKIVKAPACYNPGWDFHVDYSSVLFGGSGSASCDAGIASVQQRLSEVGGTFLPGNTWCPLGARIQKEINAPACTSDMATSASSATYSEVQFAPESLVTAFGSHLATTTTPATATPLPQSLGGTSVAVKDSAGVTRPAELFYVSPRQVNYILPPGTANGVAQVSVTSADASVSTGNIFVRSVAPSLFTADASGTGLPAAWILRVKADGSSSYEAVVQRGSDGTPLVPLPIDFGPPSDQLWLLLFGTGIRQRSSQTAVTAAVGSAPAQVGYAGPQVQYDGLDQINVLLPRSLAGAGQVNVIVSVDGQQLNPVYVNFR